MRRKKKFGEYLDESLCAALSTVRVSKLAQGDDFYKYLDTKDARATVAMLQSRKLGVGSAGRRWSNGSPT